MKVTLFPLLYAIFLPVWSQQSGHYSHEFVWSFRVVGDPADLEVVNPDGEEEGELEPVKNVAVRPPCFRNTNK